MDARRTIAPLAACLALLASWQVLAEAQPAEASAAVEPKVGERFRDCAECPEMMVVPAGSFEMGSPSSEEGRDDDEGPLRDVTIAAPFAVGVYEVTVGQFKRFVQATGHSTGDSCWVYEGSWEDRSGLGWRDPGFRQDDSHPVLCVGWEDAQAYVRWLSAKTGQRYRLPSEAEWEYAARAGTRTSRPWDDGRAGQCRHANGADASTSFSWKAGCDDGHASTSPTGSYAANGWGLHDMLGNAWEWTEDCWSGSYAGAPADGSAWQSDICLYRVVRGGSWYCEPADLRSANRYGGTPARRNNDSGFRVVRTLAP